MESNEQADGTGSDGRAPSEPLTGRERFHALIAAVSRTVTRVEDRDEVLAEACRITTDVAGYAMAWIGVIDPGGRVVPVASAGSGHDYLDTLDVTLGDPVTSAGPTATALATRTAAVCNNIATDPTMRPWRAAALAHGFASSAAFPLVNDGNTLGVLSVYASTPDAFPADEVALLADLTTDLAWAVAAASLRVQHRQAEEMSERKASALALVASGAPLRSALGEVVDAFVEVGHVGAASVHVVGGGGSTVLMLAAASGPGIGPDRYMLTADPASITTRAAHDAATVAVPAAECGCARDVFGDTTSRSSASGHWCWAAPVIDDTGAVRAVLTIHRDGDVSDPKVAGEVDRWSQVVKVAVQRDRDLMAISHANLHDVLTGLPSRSLFMDRLDHAVARLRGGLRVAVVLVDFDRFKVVNTSLGVSSADEVLVAAAARIRSALAEADTVARLGGDEFAVLLEDTTRGDAMLAAERIRVALDSPFDIDGTELYLRASIGVAVGRAALGRPDRLLRDAEIAMYASKRAGGDRIELFDEIAGESLPDRLTIETALRQGVRNGDLFAVYQPEVDLLTGVATGAEALCRWSRDDAVVSPEVFIPIAEESGIIDELGLVVLRAALSAAATWPTDRWVAVNVSGYQLTRPEIVENVAVALHTAGVEPSRLCIEITEQVFMADVSGAQRRVRALQDMGVRGAIEEFGNGYSSLARLKGFRVDFIKVDRSFVRDIVERDADKAIVAAVISLAHALGARVIAEGVEHADQHAVLVELGCDFGQGFLWGPPGPPEFLGFDSVTP